MKITIESTDKIVELVGNDIAAPARVWQGETESGIPVQVFVTRIAPEISTDNPRIDELTAEFERDLMRQADPRPSVEAIPLRMIIMTPAERHNQLAREFVTRVAAETHSYPELLVVLESIITGALLILQRVYKCSPSMASGLVEAAVQAVTERFAQEQKP